MKNILEKVRGSAQHNFEDFEKKKLPEPPKKVENKDVFSFAKDPKEIKVEKPTYGTFKL